MMELRLSVRHHGDRAMIHIGGEIDLATCPQLQAVVVDLVDRGCHQLILDLQRVSFMDCAGIRGAGRCAAARPRARRFGEAGQAQTAGVAGAGADWDDNGVPDRHLPLGRRQRRPRGRLLPHPGGLSCRPPAQPRGLPPSSGRWSRCWPIPAAPTALARSRWPSESAQSLAATLRSRCSTSPTSRPPNRPAPSARQPSGSTAATSRRAPRNASNTCTPVGSIRASTACVGCPRRAGCARPCRTPKGDVGNQTWRPCRRGRHGHQSGVTLNLGPS